MDSVPGARPMPPIPPEMPGVKKNKVEPVITLPAAIKPPLTKYRLEVCRQFFTMTTVTDSKDKMSAQLLGGKYHHIINFRITILHLYQNLTIVRKMCLLGFILGRKGIEESEFAKSGSSSC